MKYFLEKALGISWLKYAIIPLIFIIGFVVWKTWLSNHDETVTEIHDLKANAQITQQVNEDVKTINQTDVNMGSGSILERMFSEPTPANRAKQNSYSGNNRQTPDANPQEQQLPRDKRNRRHRVTLELPIPELPETPPAKILPEITCTETQAILGLDGCSNE